MGRIFVSINLLFDILLVIVPNFLSKRIWKEIIVVECSGLKDISISIRENLNCNRNISILFDYCDVPFDEII